MDEPRKGKMLWAASSLCFFGFFRSGIPRVDAFDAGTHLMFQDMQVDSLRRPRVLRVWLKSSKTDPFRVGADVYIGHTQDELCPVAAVLSYMVARGAGPGPFFCYRDGRPLTRMKLVAETKDALTKAGVNSSCYSGHSFQKGAATTAAEQGIGDATIMRLGRWQSRAYQTICKHTRGTAVRHLQATGSEVQVRREVTIQQLTQTLSCQVYICRCTWNVGTTREPFSQS